MPVKGVVYNACFGGFSLSRAAVLRARELSGNPHWGGPLLEGDVYKQGGGVVERDYGFLYDEWDVRHDPILVQVVSELGDGASGSCADLRIYECDSGTAYRIDDYDGRENVITDYNDWKVVP